MAGTRGRKAGTYRNSMENDAGLLETRTIVSNSTPCFSVGFKCTETDRPHNNSEETRSVRRRKAGMVFEDLVEIRFVENQKVHKGA